MNTVVFLYTLMSLAREEALAKKSGDPERIRNAIDKHEAYKSLCLKAEEMSLEMPIGAVPR